MYVHVWCTLTLYLENGIHFDCFNNSFCLMFTMHLNWNIIRTYWSNAVSVWMLMPDMLSWNALQCMENVEHPHGRVCACVYAVCNNIHIHMHRTSEQFTRNIQFVMHAAYLLNCCCVCNPACSLPEIQSVACGFVSAICLKRSTVRHVCRCAQNAGGVGMGVNQKMRWIIKERA